MFNDKQITEIAEKYKNGLKEVKIYMASVSLDSLDEFSQLCNELEKQGLHIVDYDFERLGGGTFYFVYRLQEVDE